MANKMAAAFAAAIFDIGRDLLAGHHHGRDSSTSAIAAHAEHLYGRPGSYCGAHGCGVG